MKRLGNYTLELEKDCYIIGRASFVGEKEKNGAFNEYLEFYAKDDKMGQKTFEKAERKMLETITLNAISDARLNKDEVDFMLRPFNWG
jgi:stage V sporulation protein AD